MDKFLPSKETVKFFATVIVAILATEMIVKPVINYTKKKMTPTPKV